MWSEVRMESGIREEQALKREYILANSCKTEHFEATFESAWRIIGRHTKPIRLRQDDLNDTIRVGNTGYDAAFKKGLKWLVPFRKRTARWQLFANPQDSHYDTDLVILAKSTRQSFAILALWQIEREQACYLCSRYKTIIEM
jgi:hypothetical protein